MEMNFVSNNLSGIESLNNSCQWYSPHESRFLILTEVLNWECGIHSSLLFKLDVSGSHTQRDSEGRGKENKPVQDILLHCAAYFFWRLPVLYKKCQTISNYFESKKKCQTATLDNSHWE